jgi:magnesium transporter
MSIEDNNLNSEELRILTEQDDPSIREYFAGVAHAADIIEFFRHVKLQEWPRLLRLIEDRDQRAEVVSGLDRGEWNKLLSLLTPKEIADVIRELETDDAADLLADVPLAERMDALRMLSPKERLQVSQLMRYPEDCAGGIMQLELAVVQENQAISEAIKKVRQLVEDDVDVWSVLVVDQNARLVGTLALVDLILNKETARVADIMDREVVSVKPLLDQEKVAALFKKYGLITVPVVDDDDHILGRIVIDDVVDVVTEEAEEDALHMAGTTAQELLYEGAIFTTARIRFPWLGVALCCSLVSGFLLHFFEGTFEQAVILLTFLPVITAMGGNVGTQSATLVIRGFATGKFDLSDMPKFLFKELRIGLLLGLVYGVFAGIVGIIFYTDHNIYFGLVVCISMACAMATAALSGVIAPSLLKRLGVDPAIASGPFVTTMNDITGIIIYLAVAGFFLAKLPVG